MQHRVCYPPPKRLKYLPAAPADSNQHQGRYTLGTHYPNEHRPDIETLGNCRFRPWVPDAVGKKNGGWQQRRGGGKAGYWWSGG